MTARHLLLDPVFQPAVAAVSAFNQACEKTKWARHPKSEVICDDNGGVQHSIGNE